LFPCTDNVSALDALINALTELDKICEAVEDGYLDSLREGKFERWNEKR
jgi:DNA-directed RNA polymerase I and III subunit RPAC2